MPVPGLFTPTYGTRGPKERPVLSKLPARPKLPRQALLRATFPLLSQYRARQPPNTHPESVAQFSHAAVTPSPPPEAQIGVLDEFWRRVPMWQDVSAAESTSWTWSLGDTVVSPLDVADKDKRPGMSWSITYAPRATASEAHLRPYGRDGIGMQSREDIIDDVFDGLARSSVSLRIM